MKKYFMIVKHVQRVRDPRKPANSSGNVQNDEIFNCATKVKKSDLVQASFIIDVANQSIVKSRFADATFESLYTYCLKNYTDYIDQWLRLQMERP